MLFTVLCINIYTYSNEYIQQEWRFYLSGQHAEEDEDEHPLEGVGDGEQIGSEGGLIEDV